MTKRFFIAIAMGAFAFIGCQKEMSQNANPGNKLIDFTAIAEINSNTKTAIEHIDEGGYQPKWVTGDVIGFYTDINNEPSTHNGKITINDVQTNGSAILKGQAAAGTHTFYAYYPYENDNDAPTDPAQTGNNVENVKVQIFACQMPGKTTFDGKSDILIAAPVENVTLTEGQESTVKFNFKRLSSVMKLNITGVDLSTVTKVSIVDPSKTLKLSGSATLNLKTGEIAHKETHTSHNIISAVYTKGSLADGDGVFMNMWPVKFAAQSKLRVRVEGITTDSGKEVAYTAIKELTFNTDKQLNEGTVYNVPVVFTENDIKTSTASPYFYETFDKTIISGTEDWNETKFRTDVSDATYTFNSTTKAIRTLPNSDAFISSSSGNNLNINKGKFFDINGIAVGKDQDFELEVNSMNGQLDIEIYTGRYSDGAIYPIPNFNKFKVAGDAINTKKTIKIAVPFADKKFNIRLKANGSAIRIDDIKLKRAPKPAEGAQPTFDYTVTFTPSFTLVSGTSNGNSITISSKVRNFNFIDNNTTPCGVWYQASNETEKTKVSGSYNPESMTLTGEATGLNDGEYTVGTYVTINGQDSYSEGITKIVSANTENLNENTFTMNVDWKKAKLIGPGKLAQFNNHQGFRAGKNKQSGDVTVLSLDKAEIGFTGNGTIKFYAVRYAGTPEGKITLTVTGGGSIDTAEITLPELAGTDASKDSFTDLVINDETMHFSCALTGITADSVIKISQGDTYPVVGMWGIRLKSAQ